MSEGWYIAMSQQVIEITHLCKSYGDAKAVNDISFSVEKGELFAFLGVNGAGKSTTIHILCGMLPPDSGCVKINGLNIEENPQTVKNRIGVVFQNSVLDKALTVYDNLKYRAALYGITGKKFSNTIERLCGEFQFSDILNRTVGKLSGGQRRKIDVARALLHEPSLLILDEPTTGLDPQTRKNLWEQIERRRKEEGLTVLLTTHYMEEAANADNVVILDGGKIAARGTPNDLKTEYACDYITLYHISEEQAKLLSLPYTKIGGAYRFAIKNTADTVKLIERYPSLFADFEVTKGSMDDVFLALTGKSLGDMRV
jgi:multidrug/hemolysin transport system ATP-binding protein